MLSLSAIAKAEKNKLSTDSAPLSYFWIFALKNRYAFVITSRT